MESSVNPMQFDYLHTDDSDLFAIPPDAAAMANSCQQFTVNAANAASTQTHWKVQTPTCLLLLVLFNLFQNIKSHSILVLYV